LTIGQGIDAANSLLEMNGFSQEVNGLTWVAGTASSTRGIGNAIAATQSVLTINSASSLSYGAVTGITGGVITGNIRLVKAGTGTQTLGGADTYAGATDINGGNLRITGTHVGGASYTVANGATLSGNGAITLSAAATSQVL